MQETFPETLSSIYLMIFYFFGWFLKLNAIVPVDEEPGTQEFRKSDESWTTMQKGPVNL